MQNPPDFSDDLVINIIQQGIKRGIDVTLDHHCFGSAVVLIYSAIDAMAFLGMPAAKVEVTRDDFIDWCDRYIRFPCKNQVTGLEFYAARCAMVHSWGTESRLSRSGDVREIAYMSESIPEVRYDESAASHLVLVSIPAMRKCLFDGIDRFLIDTFSDANRAKVAENRLNLLVHAIENNAEWRDRLV